MPNLVNVFASSTIKCFTKRDLFCLNGVADKWKHAFSEACRWFTLNLLLITSFSFRESCNFDSFLLLTMCWFRHFHGKRLKEYLCKFYKFQGSTWQEKIRSQWVDSRLMMFTAPIVDVWNGGYSLTPKKIFTHSTDYRFGSQISC